MENQSPHPHLLVVDIGALAGAGPAPEQPLRGSRLSELDILPNAFCRIVDGRIDAFGPMSKCPPAGDAEVIDASQRFVLPCWCDAHTHIVYAGSRELEFVDRLRGLSYQEIARRGGGILHSAERLRNCPEEELLQQSRRRVEEVMRYGTGALEIKSGYGLTAAGEYKMLSVIQSLRREMPLPIRATFLGAHALPSDYHDRREAYLDRLTEEWIPHVAREKMADFVDVFCERGFFTAEETDRILEAGRKYGLRGKIHTNQFTSQGGIEAALQHGALSVDHLEVTTEEEIRLLADSDTIATLLPSAPFFLNDPYPDARALIEAGAAVALATDFNPGSSPSGRMPFVISLACVKMGMLPEEAVNAATINGAFAMDLQDDCGSISVGKLANLIITRPMPSLAYLPYAFGSDLIETTLIRGRAVR